MEYNGFKIIEKHDNALYSVHCEIDLEAFDGNFKCSQTIFWTVYQRRETLRTNFEDWIIIDKNETTFKIDPFVDEFINASFDRTEILLMINILQSIKNFNIIKIFKYNTPCLENQFPSMNSATHVLRQMSIADVWINLSAFVPEEEIKKAFNDSGIEIVGVIKANVLDENHITPYESNSTSNQKA